MNEDEDFSNVTIHRFLFQNHTLETITETMIAQNTINGTFAESVPLADFRIHNLKVNEGVFSRRSQNILAPIVTVTQDDNQLLVTCVCCDESPKLCVHETEVLLTLLIINDYGIFFKEHYRHQQLRKFGKDYGLDHVENPDEHFDMYYDDKRLHTVPRNEALLKVTEHSIKNISDSLELLQSPEIALQSNDANEKKGIILRQHKFHKYLIVDLFSAATTKSGAVKNPLNVLSPLDFLWQSDDSNLLKFFAAIHKLQQHTDGKRSKDDINALKALIKNPEGYPFYIHNASISEKITLNALQPAKPSLFAGKIVLDINKTGDLYQLSASIDNKGIQHSIKGIILKFNYFLELDKDLYLVEKLELFNLIEFLRQKENDIVIHASKFKLFKTQILEKLADKVIVNYKYIPAASQHQLREQGFNHINRKIIYLSESGNHILITPTISYSDTEIPVKSKRQVYGQDNDGNEFLVQRDQEAEIAFTALVSRQHPFFEEQVENDHEHFYLHKERFIDESWFPDVFEEWANNDVLVLGFNELEGNKLNPHKIKVNIKVMSGINWFNAEVKVLFGKKQVPLKSIQKSIKHKSKYIQLDDGTLGILPEEWIEKFKDYFNAGELDGASLLIDRIHYSVIESLFQDAELDATAYEDIRKYEQKWNDFSTVNNVNQPKDLLATLRPYQLQGLNWLNLLDEMNFGGCLADDMGLGKTIQIIAFILLQREKVTANTNLLIVPATLISNWQNEIEKFAPSIKTLTVYGADRTRHSADFNQYEVVLTSYGTLLSDIEYLKTFDFNYIFLDESQNIKNPESQRYKAVRLLQDETE